MTDSVNSTNFTIGTDESNIHLDEDGNSHSMANRHDGDDPTRMMIHDGSGAVTIGAAGLASSSQQGKFGQLQLLNESGRRTVNLPGGDGQLEPCAHGLVPTSPGVKTTDLEADRSRLRLCDDSGRVVIDPHGQVGELTPGGENAVDGDPFITDSDGNATIRCNGNDGLITRVSLSQTGESLRTNVAPLTNALESVLAVRGVRYQGKPVTAPTAAADGDAQQIGFVGQEVAAACPAATPGGKP